MTTSPNSPAAIAALLDDEIDVTEVAAIFRAIDGEPTLVSLFAAIQFVRDALHGHPCPDRGYSRRIMRHIAQAEQRVREDVVVDESVNDAAKRT